MKDFLLHRAFRRCSEFLQALPRMLTGRAVLIAAALLWAVTVLGGALLTLPVPRAALAFNPQPEPPGYSMVGMPQGSVMRVYLLNLATPRAGRGCQATVDFVDEFNASHMRVALPAVQSGHAAFAEFPFPAGRAGRLPMRPVITYQGDAALCRRTVSSLEIFDGMTQQTMVYTDPLTLVGFNPQPEPPGSVGVR